MLVKGQRQEQGHGGLQNHGTEGEHYIVTQRLPEDLVATKRTKVVEPHELDVGDVETGPVGKAEQQRAQQRHQEEDRVENERRGQERDGQQPLRRPRQCPGTHTGAGHAALD